MIQDYGFRLYNPSIGKFLSVDPLSKIYPILTPYQFASNTPISSFDIVGLEAAFGAGYLRSQESLKIKAARKEYYEKQIKYIKNVALGFGEVLLNTVGAITQLGDRVHFGDEN